MEEYITKDRLKRTRGWTDKLINRFLPEPDKRVTNPQDKNYPEMCQYSLRRVKAVEWSEEFLEAVKNRRKPRRKRS